MHYGNAFTHTDMHIEHRHAHRRRNKQNQHTHIEQFHVSSRLWILFFVLLVSMSPNTCSGACVMHVPNLARTRNLYHVIQPLTVTGILSFILVAIPKFRTQLYCLRPPARPHIYTPLLQRSRRMISKTSETPLRHVCADSIGTMVDWLDRSGSGTFQEWKPWIIYLPVPAFRI